MNFERLQSIREDHDLKQIDIANVLNVKQVNISNWERSKEVIPLNKLNKLSNYYNVSLDYLSGLSNKQKKTNTCDLNSKVVGNNLRNFRREKEMTQVELASFLNTTHSTISAYESGKTLILTSFAYQICKKYNISLDWLCGKSEKMYL